MDSPFSSPAYTKSPLVNSCIIGQDRPDPNDKLLVRRSQLEKAAEMVKALEDENRSLKEQLAIMTSLSEEGQGESQNTTSLTQLVKQLEEENRELILTIKKNESLVDTYSASANSAKIREQKLQSTIEELEKQRNTMTVKYETELHRLGSVIEDLNSNLKRKEQSLQKQLTISQQLTSDCGILEQTIQELQTQVKLLEDQEITTDEDEDNTKGKSQALIDQLSSQNKSLIVELSKLQSEYSKLEPALKHKIEALTVSRKTRKWLHLIVVLLTVITLVLFWFPLEKTPHV
ncbi:hypothetical protein RCL1_003381 [Eukaryota sp. TZLM3-RCL]